jgi:hypothetical protein
MPNANYRHRSKILEISIFAALLLPFVAGLSCGREEIVQRVSSEDGRFSAETTLDRGSPISGPDMYFVTLEESAPGGNRKQACAMTGNGQISVSWTGRRALTVICKRCKRNDLRIDFQNWEGVQIAYAFED